MSFSDKNNRIPKVLVFKPASTPVPMMDAAQSTTSKSISFLLNGQGVFLFSLQKVIGEKKLTMLKDGEKIVLNLLNEAKNDGLRLEIGYNSIRLTRIASGTTLSVSETKGILPNTNANYWLSLDSHNFFVRYGIGEARLETQNFAYEFSYPKGDEEKKEALRAFLESITTIELEPQEKILPLKLLRDPIVQAVSLFIKDTAELTMMDIANNRFLPRANLSPIAQKLYDNIAGEKFVINTPDFPQFTQAVEYSIATKGCWCNKVLERKSTEFGSDNPLQTYLRITLGANSGESPGVPYVMEIWPPSHYSPIHNHAGANAIIRVLHGAISVKLFRFLDENEGYAVQTFSEGDVTWISPDLNQIHQLKNLDGNVETCITIQCYMYDVEDETHYDYFDYLGDNEEIGHFDPDSDADFADFKAIIQNEWNEHLATQEEAFLKNGSRI
jgi:predicted metal-dependent enzyme (double-stranded beta helix superfamily)